MLSAEKRAVAEQQLAEYGYSLTENDQIQKGEKVFSAVVSAKGPRLYVKQLNGAPLWSGRDLGDFVSAFWFAKKVEHRANGERDGEQLYDQLLAAGATLDNHESDLYVLATPEAREIVQAWARKRKTAAPAFSTFRSEVDGKTWLDVPFEYLPFWDKKRQRNATVELTRAQLATAKTKLREFYRVNRTISTEEVRATLEMLHGRRGEYDKMLQQIAALLGSGRDPIAGL